MKKRKNHSAGFKTKVVLEALQERETIQEIGKKYEFTSEPDFNLEDTIFIKGQ